MKTYSGSLRRNARLCNIRSGKVGSSHCYLDQRPLHESATFAEIVYECDKKTFSTIDIRCIIKNNFEYVIQYYTRV